MMRRMQFEQWLPADLEEVFLFFANPGNLPRIMPPSSGTELLEVRLVQPPGVDSLTATVTDSPPIAGVGSEIVTSFRLLPFLPFRGTWVARITEFEWNHHFADEQKKGPFRSFHHRHELAPEARQGRLGTRVRDVIDYDVGFGVLGNVAGRIVIRPLFRSMFQYRQEATDRLIAG